LDEEDSSGFVSDPNTIPDCTTEKKEEISETGDHQETVQKRDTPGQATLDTTPQQWTDAQNKAEKTAQDKARQNRKLSISNLLDKYKCSDSNCPDLVLTTKLFDLEKVYSQKYTKNFDGTNTWRERGWEASYKARATVVVKCGRVI